MRGKPLFSKARSIISIAAASVAACSRRTTLQTGLCALSLLIGQTSTTQASQAATNAPSSGPSNLLLFLDGASLHGSLKSIDPQHGIQWQHPAARNVIKFTPKNISQIKFEDAKRINISTPHRCWFQFANGDQLTGNLKSMDTDKIRLETWFGGDLEAPRGSVRSVTFFAQGYTVLYEGPSNQDGWKTDRGPRGWQYRDGAFVTSSAGILGRNLGLSQSSSVEFDLAWNGHFSMSFLLYTDSSDKFDYSSSSYMFHLAPGYINLQRIQSGAGVNSLGQAPIPGMAKKNKAKFEIRTNKEEATIAVFVDGTLVHRWKDHSGFVGKGPSIVFSAQMDGPAIRIGNMKVAQWSGSLEPQRQPEGPSKEDVVYLANNDKVSGQIQSIQDGKVTFQFEKNKLAVPVERITQIVFHEPVTNTIPSNPWDMQVEVSGGGSVSFRLESWGENEVTGTSANFGKLTVNPQSIRQVQFNVAQKLSSKLKGQTDDLQWEGNE